MNVPASRYESPRVNTCKKTATKDEPWICGRSPQNVTRGVSALLDLLADHQSNVALYPSFQAYFRTWAPPMLVVWGRNDPFFPPPGAEAFTREFLKFLK